LHLQECFAGLGYRKGDFPQTETPTLESLALLIYPKITEAQQLDVVGQIMEFYDQ
jgi:UDP-2-acetamido-2-deoxy-ribo-hexuluronate aminotransferase